MQTELDTDPDLYMEYTKPQNWVGGIQFIGNLTKNPQTKTTYRIDGCGLQKGC